MTGPVLWFANRGTGVVLLGLLTATTVIGVLSTVGPGSSRWPRFLTQGLHRNIALLTMTFLTAHVATAVLDEYVDIRWWQAIVPVGATYRPAWLELGALALDLLAAVTLTSLVRHRMRHRPWRAVHLLSYLAWASALAHGLGIGTDSATPWGRATTWASVGLVAAAAVVRVTALRGREVHA